MGNELIALLVTNIIAPWLVWFFARKKNIAEAQLIELEVVQEAIKIWRDTAEELQVQVKVLQTQMKELKEQNEMLRKEIHELRNERK
jgi:cell division protein FtsB